VCADTWNFLRKKKEIVDWGSLVWFPYALPKQAFILWLVMKNRLTTGDRMLCWGYTSDIKCVFCRHFIESRDHLFFSCSFTYRIWKVCMQRCSPLVPPSDWSIIVRDECKNWKAKSMVGIVYRLILSSTVYDIWRARNEIKHHGQPRTEEQILKSIFWEVRTRILGRGCFKRTT
jgi:hypothetical protein